MNADKVDQSSWWQMRLDLTGIEGGALNQNLGYRRVIRTLRIMVHAAVLLEKEAKSMKSCHTMRGRWSVDEPEVKAAYDDLVETARQLRALNRG